MSILNSTTIPTLQSVASTTFGWFDYVIFSLMLGFSALIGIYFGCFGSKQSTTNEYLLGGKSMKVLPIVISLVSSRTSGITLLGIPAEVFRYGSAYWLVVLCMAIVPFFTVYIYLPVYFNLQITSTYEYLELRFDARNRRLASLIFAVSMFLFLPISIYIPSLVVARATGCDVHYIIPIICGVCIFYTTIGGLKAVVWTATLQFTITLGAVITVFILGCTAAGGLGNVWRRSIEGHRMDVFDFDLDPTKEDTFWMLAIGYTIFCLSGTVASQGCVQKFLAIATLEDSKKAVWWYAFGIALQRTFSVLTGLIIYAKYADCDPFKTGEVQRNYQLLPYYVNDVAGDIPGLPGLFIAGVVSAALSTLSAYLNCMSATIYKDFLSKLMPASTTEQTASNILKLIVLVVGIMCAALIYVVEHFRGIISLAITLSGACVGTSLGQFTLGILVPRCNSKGAFWGVIISLVCMCWIVFASQYYAMIGAVAEVEKPTSTDACPAYMNITSAIRTTMVPPTVVHSQPFILYRISSYYYALIGIAITVAIGYVISLFTKEDEKTFRMDLVSPLVHFLVPRRRRFVEDNVEYFSVNEALHIVTHNSEKVKEVEANPSA